MADDRMDVFYQEASKHLNRIAALLKPQWKLTLICRYVGDDKQDADIVMSSDYLPLVRACIEKNEARKPTHQGEGL